MTSDLKGKIVFADIILEHWSEWDIMVKVFEDAMQAGGLNVLKKVEHKFEPHGVTCIWLLSESHMAVHTWPENNFFSIDIFTCGMEGNPGVVLDYIKDTFKVVSCSSSEKRRGLQ